MTEVLAALALGVAGSSHCAAMCGPLLLAWRQQGSDDRAWTRGALHHGGRIGAYALLGLLAGVAGEVVANRGFAQTLSITAGGVLLLMAAGRMGLRLPRLAGLAASVRPARALFRLRRHQTTHPMISAVLAGVTNALLPCGLLYAALTSAAAVADPLRAAQAMAAFGLGTAPPLVAIWWSAGTVSRIVRRRLAALSPVVLIVTGVLLIVRGVGDRSAAAGPSPAFSTVGGVHAHSGPP
jgi:uncharacterized protein